MTEVKPILYWLGPELARRGLLKNEPWVERVAHEAQNMFNGRALQTTAVLMALADEFAIDYLRQAPILVVLKSEHAEEIAQRRVIAKTWYPVARRRPRLASILREKGIPRPLRAIHSALWCDGDALLARLLCLQPPSVLAQSIPVEIKDWPEGDNRFWPLGPRAGQMYWLHALRAWIAVMARRGASPSDRLTWLLREAPRLAFLRVEQDLVARVADFAVLHGILFNERWSWARATAESDRWHAAVAVTSGEEQFRKRYGIGWTDEVACDPFPADSLVDGHRFVALRSGAALFEEGRAMHHCVGSYAADMITGKARLFSIRDAAGNRVATMEVSRRMRLLPIVEEEPPSPERPQSSWHIAQVKASCNGAPTKAVSRAAAQWAQAHQVDPGESIDHSNWEVTLRPPGREALQAMGIDLSSISDAPAIGIYQNGRLLGHVTNVQFDVPMLLQRDKDGGGA